MTDMTENKNIPNTLEPFHFSKTIGGTKKVTTKMKLEIKHSLIPQRLIQNNGAGNLRSKDIYFLLIKG